MSSSSFLYFKQTGKTGKVFTCNSLIWEAQSYETKEFALCLSYFFRENCRIPEYRAGTWKQSPISVSTNSVTPLSVILYFWGKRVVEPNKHMEHFFHSLCNDFHAFAHRCSFFLQFLNIYLNANLRTFA